MNKLLANINSLTEHTLNSNRVIIGPKMGQDVAVIDMGDKYLISKTDPITFATDKIGYYAVNVNANDIITSGATPKWFQSTILLPEKSTDEDLVKTILTDIATECNRHNIALIGGHTEITLGLDRPIVVGSMFGEVEKGKLIRTDGGKPGDALIITKGIVIEGAAIIASEKEEELLEKGVDPQIIQKAKQFLFDDVAGISVIKEGLLLSKNFGPDIIHAMHDPTEGGLASGVVEMARISSCGVQLYFEQIKILPESKILCHAFDLDPLGTITSGTLLIAASLEKSDDIIRLLKENGIDAMQIGHLTSDKEKYLISLNKKLEKETQKPLKFSDIDEITKIFSY